MIITAKSLIIDGNKEPPAINQYGNVYSLRRHEKNGIFRWGEKELMTVYERNLVGGSQLDYFRRIEQKYAGRLPNANVLDFLIENQSLIPWEPWGGTPYVFVGTEFSTGIYRCFNWYDGRKNDFQHMFERPSHTYGYFLEDPDNRPPLIVIFSE